MSNESPIDDVKKGVEVIAEIVKAAGDHPDVKASGAQLAETALTVTTAVNVCLLPLAAMNYGVAKAKEYFQTRFARDVDEATKHIPPEHIVEPKPSVVGPALQALAFTHEEEQLKNLYLKLMATAMDGRSASKAHPAFVEVIKQMTSEEAVHLYKLLKFPYLPMAELKLHRHDSTGHQVLARHLIPYVYVDTGEQLEHPGHETMVDNWARLGLVTVTYQTLSLSGSNAYDWVRKRPEYLRLKELHETKETEVLIGKGLLTVTSFGRQFADAVGVRAVQSSPPQGAPA
jgi:hypothetical protein